MFGESFWRFRPLRCGQNLGPGGDEMLLSFLNFSLSLLVFSLVFSKQLPLTDCPSSLRYLQLSSRMKLSRNLLKRILGMRRCWAVRRKRSRRSWSTSTSSWKSVIHQLRGCLILASSKVCSWLPFPKVCVCVCVCIHVSCVPCPFLRQPVISHKFRVSVAAFAQHFLSQA